MKPTNSVESGWKEKLGELKLGDVASWGDRERLQAFIQTEVIEKLIDEPELDDLVAVREAFSSDPNFIRGYESACKDLEIWRREAKAKWLN